MRQKYQYGSIPDFVHHPGFEILENTAFQKLDLFPSSGEGERGTYSVEFLRKS
jgi:hypothetical protein